MSAPQTTLVEEARTHRVQSCVVLLPGAYCIGVAVPALSGALRLLAAGSAACTLIGCGLWGAALRTER